MKTIIVGSRKGISVLDVCDAIENCGWDITEVVSGCAVGVDTIGEEIAHALGIPISKFPADWKLHGKAAGPIRNRQMAENSEALIAVWDGVSVGTKDMIQTAKKKGLKVFVHIVDLHQGVDEV